MIHLHASRNGPPLANDIYLARHERRRHPDLAEIVGVVQPGVSVAKLFDYWLSGLPLGTTRSILSGLAFLDFLQSDGRSNLTLLQKRANEVTVPWKATVQAMFLPLVESAGLLRADVEAAESLGPDQSASLEATVIGSGQFILNQILVRSGLPVIRYITLADEDISRFANKHVDTAAAGPVVEQGYRSHERSVSQAVATVDKRLKGIRLSRQVTPADVTKTHSALMQRGDGQYRAAAVPLEYLVARFTTGDHEQFEPVLRFQAGIAAAVGGLQLSVRPGAGTDRAYIDGASMIRAAFAVAEREGLPLALQEFIRLDGDPYAKYEQCHVEFPSVECLPSSVRIWDTNRFPEFDTNLVGGLHYATDGAHPSAVQGLI